MILGHDKTIEWADTIPNEVEQGKAVLIDFTAAPE